MLKVFCDECKETCKGVYIKIEVFSQEEILPASSDRFTARAKGDFDSTNCAITWLKKKNLK